MLEAFQATANYDAMIAQHLAGVFPGPLFPSTLTVGMEKVQDLRYGENPIPAGGVLRRSLRHRRGRRPA